MIHKLREYRFSQQDWPTYQILFEEKGMSARRNEFGRLLGAWNFEAEDNFIGFIHLWLAMKPDYMLFDEVRLAALSIESALRKHLRIAFNTNQPTDSP